MLINTRMPSQATGYSYHFFVLKLYVTTIVAGLCAAKLKNVDGKYVQFFANGGYAIKYWKNGYEQYSSYQSSTEKIA